MNEQQRILEELERRTIGRSLELLLIKGFGLSTASPLQRAICRVCDGRPLGELAQDAAVQAAIGRLADLPCEHGRIPPEILILSGIRTGKSLISAALAVRATQTCDLSKLRVGETPRVSVVSVTMDLARVIYGHVLGSVMASEMLRSLLVGEPTADSITLRHPSGIPVEIKIVAGSKAGASLVARWSAGCVFDEAGRMNGADDGVVNLEDARDAVLGRLLPGAMVAYVTSPWAPAGPVWQWCQEFEGRPTDRFVCVRAPAYAMNPVYWTDERRAELLKQSPEVYRTDVDCHFRDPETSLLTSVEIDRATRKSPVDLPFQQGADYVAAIDPATRGNSWTLVVATRRGGKIAVALAREWRGSKADPLSPRVVLQQVAQLCRIYGLSHVFSDQWSGDALRDLADESSLDVVLDNPSQATRLERYQSFATRLSTGQVELHPDPVLRADLLSVKKRVTTTSTTIVLPKTQDGRHADYAPACVLACSKYLEDAKDEAPVPTMQDTLRQQHLDKWRQRQEDKAQGIDWYQRQYR